MRKKECRVSGQRERTGINKARVAKQEAGMT